MGLFNSQNEKDKVEKLQKAVESFRQENTQLKEAAKAQFQLTTDYEDSSRTLKELLAVVEAFRKIENEEYVLDVNDSVKSVNDIFVSVLDAKTKKPVFAIVASGRDKKAKKRFYPSYQYLVSKATLVFEKGAEIKVPEFLIEETGWVLTQHINNWSNKKDQKVGSNIDSALKKLGV